MSSRAWGRRLVATIAFAELEEGRPKRLRHPPYHVLVVRLGEDVFAIEDACNHGNASLTKGSVVDGDCVACPLHGYVFSLRTGALVRPKSLCDDQRRFEVEREGELVHIYEPEALLIVGP